MRLRHGNRHALRLLKFLLEFNPLTQNIQAGFLGCAGKLMAYSSQRDPARRFKQARSEDPGLWTITMSPGGKAWWLL